MKYIEVHASPTETYYLHMHVKETSVRDSALKMNITSTYFNKDVYNSNSFTSCNQVPYLVACYFFQVIKMHSRFLKYSFTYSRNELNRYLQLLRITYRPLLMSFLQIPIICAILGVG